MDREEVLRPDQIGGLDEVIVAHRVREVLRQESHIDFSLEELGPGMCPYGTRSKLVHFRNRLGVSRKVDVESLHGNQVAVAFSLDVERMSVISLVVDVVCRNSRYRKADGRYAVSVFQGDYLAVAELWNVQHAHKVGGRIHVQRIVVQIQLRKRLSVRVLGCSGTHCQKVVLQDGAYAAANYESSVRHRDLFYGLGVVMVCMSVGQEDQVGLLAARKVKEV